MNCEKTKDNGERSLQYILRHSIGDENPEHSLGFFFDTLNEISDRFIDLGWSPKVFPADDLCKTFINRNHPSKSGLYEVKISMGEHDGWFTAEFAEFFNGRRIYSTCVYVTAERYGLSAADACKDIDFICDQFLKNSARKIWP